jgi:hypothetical protein
MGRLGPPIHDFGRHKRQPIDMVEMGGKRTQTTAGSESALRHICHSDEPGGVSEANMWARQPGDGMGGLTQGNRLNVRRSVG